jgi:hypothetical protein
MAKKKQIKIVRKTKKKEIVYSENEYTRAISDMMKTFAPNVKKIEFIEEEK